MSHSWWWISFSSQKSGIFCGVGIAFARSFDEALNMLGDLGIAPERFRESCRMDGAPIPIDWGSPPFMKGGLYDQGEAELLAIEWDPAGRGIADGSELEQYAHDPVVGGSPPTRPR